MINTLQIVKEAQEVGFTSAQAEFWAEKLAAVVQDQMATKQDIHRLEQDIQTVKQDVQRVERDVQRVERELKREIKQAVFDLKKDFKKDLKYGFKDLEHKILLKMGAMLVASITVMGMFNKFF